MNAQNQIELQNNKESHASHTGATVEAQSLKVPCVYHKFEINEKESVPQLIREQYENWAAIRQLQPSGARLCVGVGDLDLTSSNTTMRTSQTHGVHIVSVQLQILGRQVQALIKFENQAFGPPINASASVHQ